MKQTVKLLVLALVLVFQASLALGAGGVSAALTGQDAELVYKDGPFELYRVPTDSVEAEALLEEYAEGSPAAGPKRPVTVVLDAWLLDNEGYLITSVDQGVKVTYRIVYLVTKNGTYTHTWEFIAGPNQSKKKNKTYTYKGITDGKPQLFWWDYKAATPNAKGIHTFRGIVKASSAKADQMNSDTCKYSVPEINFQQ